VERRRKQQIVVGEKAFHRHTQSMSRMKRVRQYRSGNLLTGLRERDEIGVEQPTSRDVHVPYALRKVH
jgi:hypothetical protein